MRTSHAIGCVLAVLLAAATAESAPGRGAAQADAIDAPRITQQAFKKLVAADNVLVIDTRNLDAFTVSHMRGALPLPLEGRLTWPDEYEKTVALALKSKKPVVTYCA